MYIITPNDQISQLLSYFSGHPLCHKIGTIYGMVDRAILLSHLIFQQKNLEFVINTLLVNDYLIDLVFNKTKYRIKKLIEKFNKSEERTEKADRKIIAFSYIKNVSEIDNSAIDKNIFLIGYRIK